MDYSRIYIELMERAVDRVIDGYTENHHVVPKCMGGDNKPRNIVRLTPEEHYVAHQLLVKIYPKNRKLAFAANMMVTSNDGHIRSNKLYGWLKKKLSEANKGNKHGCGNKGNTGRKHTEASKKKMSESRRGVDNSFFGKTHSDEVKQLIKEKRKLQKFSEETRKKMSETRRKIHRPNSTGYLGVSKSGKGKFVACIWVMGKPKHLGTFESAKDAGDAYQKYKTDNNL